ncbi:hypothetical protein Pla108_23820 [Botrimarina colliarenosi]|uniref:Putative restriction endonuclease domain-containing protein n=1 Tax=Botrimarina colliarenosi TaxID=2528001 RepID=A0A5C6AEF5_9BACT|nr:Uma2 family endonuclease [Botrimarina colliarenosi]TWT96613.1 hypothetical protein Pla108_23820 [Botrimarina colliarenosi]
MSTQTAPKTTTAADYLAFERKSEEKHEFVNGQIRLMSGASRNHNRIAANIGTLLGVGLKGKPCEHFISDMRVKVASGGRYTYPDLSVVCGGPEFEDDVLDTLLNPNAIFEILSKSTAEYDRGDKFASYRNLPSLKEYLLVSQDAPQVEHFTRLDDGAWRFNPTEGLDSEVRLVTAEVVLTLRDIYDKVSFEGKEN